MPASSIYSLLANDNRGKKKEINHAKLSLNWGKKIPFDTLWKKQRKKRRKISMFLFLTNVSTWPLPPSKHRSPPQKQPTTHNPGNPPLRRTPLITQSPLTQKPTGNSSVSNLAGPPSPSSIHKRNSPVHPATTTTTSPEPPLHHRRNESGDLRLHHRFMPSFHRSLPIRRHTTVSCFK